MRTPRLPALSVSVFAAGLVLGGTATSGASTTTPPAPPPVVEPVEPAAPAAELLPAGTAAWEGVLQR